MRTATKPTVSPKSASRRQPGGHVRVDYARIATRALLVWIAAMVAIGVVYTLLQ